MKRLKKVLLLTLTATTMSACSTGGMSQIGNSENGQFAMFGDEKGIQAAMDGFTGLITTGKASPDGDDAHHELRRTQETHRTIRHNAKYQGGFASKKGGAK